MFLVDTKPSDSTRNKKFSCLRGNSSLSLRLFCEGIGRVDQTTGYRQGYTPHKRSIIMLTTNCSPVVEERITNVDYAQALSNRQYGGNEDSNKTVAAYILFPSIEQLDEFFELLPFLKDADICFFSEPAICHLLHMADPFDAIGDLLHRGVKGIIVLRPHSSVVATCNHVRELIAPNGVELYQYLSDYLYALQMHSKSDREPLDVMENATIELFAQLERAVAGKKPTGVMDLFMSSLSFLSRFKDAVLPFRRFSYPLSESKCSIELDSVSAK